MKINICIKDENNKIIKFRKTEFPDSNPEEWRGVTVFGECEPDGSLLPIVMDLLPKARKLAEESCDKTQILLIGSGLIETARGYFAYGADRVFIYDDPSLINYSIDQCLKIMAHFIDNFKPAAIFFSDTPDGNTLVSHILDHAKLSGNNLTSSVEQETADFSFVPDPARLGELVICEIPR